MVANLSDWGLVLTTVGTFMHLLYVTGFEKINHFVTFDTLNISSLNKAFHSINQHNSELSISLYHELLETFRNISRAACVLLW